MADQFIGEIRMFGGNFAPNGWAFCNGQLLSISQATALFSLLGTFYGGDGRSNFALPNLQNATPIGLGQGPGLTVRQIGETGGEATVALSGAQLATHTHPASSKQGTTAQPDGAIPAAHGRYVAGAVALAGAQPHNNRPPYLGLTFIIALVGIFPARS
jgi:microcystin-dependent protein